MTTIFYIALHILGLLCVLPFSRKIPFWLFACTGFVWGLLLWMACSLVSLFLGLSYTWVNMVFLLIPPIIIVLFSIIRTKTYRLASKQWIAIVGSIVVISILSYIVTYRNYVYATQDSFGYIYHGRALAKSGLIPWTIDYFTKLGPFSSIIQMNSQLLPGNFLSGYQTILAFILVTLLFVSTCELFRKKFSLVISTFLAGAIVLVLGSTIFLHHAFYIHNNLPAAVLLFLALYSFWNMLKTDTSEWIPLGMIALTGFSFTRIEGPLYSIVILLLVISIKEQPYRRILGMVIPYTVITLAWHFYLISAVTHNELLSQTNLLLIISALAGLALLAVISPKITFLLDLLPGLLISSLVFALVLAVLIEPDHMIASLTHFWQNLSNIYFWGWSWFVVLASLPFLIMNNQEHPENRLLVFVFISYVLIVLLLSLFRIPYRLGQTDSANRLMLQILPVLYFAIASNADNLRRWFSPLKNYP